MKCRDCEYCYNNETMGSLYICVNGESSNFGEYVGLLSEDDCPDGKGIDMENIGGDMSEQKYYLFEKGEENNYKSYTLNELKDYFFVEENDKDDEEYNKSLNAVSSIEEMEEFIEFWVNNYRGMHYHDYYIEAY